MIAAFFPAEQRDFQRWDRIQAVQFSGGHTHGSRTPGGCRWKRCEALPELKRELVPLKALLAKVKPVQLDLSSSEPAADPAAAPETDLLDE